VPEGCVAVLSANGQCPDVLSHSAVRARNMDVLLAACYSPEVWHRCTMTPQHLIFLPIVWPEPYICTVYDRIFGDLPAKITVYTPVLANPTIVTRYIL